MAKPQEDPALQEAIADPSPATQLTATRLNAYVGFAVYDGDEIDVYPWSNPDLDVVIQGCHGVSEYNLDELDVYPHG